MRNYTAEEIDKIFAHETCITDDNLVENIKTNISEAHNLVTALEFLNSDVTSCQKALKVHKMKLEKLGDEILEIQDANVSIKQEILNLESTRDTLKHLIVQLETDEEHFYNLENPNFNDLATLKLSLSHFNTFHSDFEIKAVVEKREKMNKTVNIFLKKFCVHFDRILSTYRQNECGEIKLHSELYGRIKNLEFIIDFCKMNCKEVFLSVTNKYMVFAKKSYEHQFDTHLKVVFKALKTYDKKLDSKMKEVVVMVIESFSAVVRAETAFIKRLFFDGINFIHEYIKGIFTEVAGILYDFTRDLFRINKMALLESLKASTESDFDLESENTRFFDDFINNLKKIYDNLANERIILFQGLWKSESRRTAVIEISEETSKSSDLNFKNRVAEFLSDRISKIEKGNRGKVEIIVFKLNLVYTFESTVSEIEFHFNDMKKALYADLEKEVTAYVLSVDDSKIKSKLNNLYNLFIELSHQNGNFLLVIRNAAEASLIKNCSHNQMSLITEFFNKKKNRP